MGTDLGWETANDVRREAAPLMAPTPERGASTATATEVDQPVDTDGLTAVYLPILLQGGTMLTGAKELLDSRPAPSIWVNPADAGSAIDGHTVAVTGDRGSVDLVLRVTPAVAPGTVVLPRIHAGDIGRNGITIADAQPADPVAAGSANSNGSES